MSDKSYITQYLEAIRKGDIVVGNRIRTIYERLQHDIEHPGAYFYDDKAARKPIVFIERFLRHSKGSWLGKPVRLMPWEKALISAIYGFLDDKGNRRYSEVFLCCGRKCGKSLIASCLAVYQLFCEGQQDIYCAATKLDQAKIIFDECYRMISQSRLLSSKARKRRTDVYVESTYSTVRPLASLSSSLDGLNSSMLVCDEFHGWQGVRGRELYDVLRQSQSARDNTLLLEMTTAGTVRNGVFDDIFGMAGKVLSGEVEDDHFLPVIYMLDDDDEWDNPEVYAKANPSLGVVKKMDFLLDELDRAKEGDPVSKSTFICKDLNRISTSVNSWLTFDELNNTDTFDLADYRGKWGILGVDLSMTTDLTAACVLIHDTDDKFVVHTMYWIPSDTALSHVRKDNVPYDLWHDNGLIRYCPGNVIDPHMVTEWALEIVKQHGISIRWCGFDPYSSRYWQVEMEKYGFTMIPVRQGHKTLSGPMQILGADLKAKRINYNNNPILKWNLTNTSVDISRNGTIAPIKAGPDNRRIDGVAALLCAYVVLQDHKDEFLALG